MLPLLWCFLCLPWRLLAADKCSFHQSPLKVSPMMDSLHCYNDHKSHFHCTWREDPKSDSNRSMKLWFYKKSFYRRHRLPCEDLSSDVEGTKECRYNTTVLGLGSKYIAFFKQAFIKDPQELCPSIQPTRQELSQLLRAQAPVGVATSSTNDTGRLITWSSPYPPASALNDDIIYQVNYRLQGPNEWMAKQLNETQVKLEKLFPGQGYEARVRARFRLGPWSHWSPIVSWNTPFDPEQAPRVDCELRGEREARCSWEQSIELSHFISYQLVCRTGHTDTPRECCEDPAVSRREDKVRLSCLLRPTQPFTSTLLIELVPTTNSKVLIAVHHIRPNPPTNVSVTKKDVDWFVKWTPPLPKKLIYEVRHYSQKNEKDAKNYTSDKPSFSIPASSLTPSHTYWVQVRAQVVNPDNVPPSDWSKWSLPVKWTSQAEDKRRPPEDSVTDVIYAAVGILVSAGFIFFTFFIVPACRRRVILWVQSIPSPYKSKVILDIQVKHPAVTVSEEALFYKVMDMDRMSTCSTIVSVRPKERLDTQTGEASEDEGVGSWPTSSSSFNGPYIFCKSKPVEEDISEQTKPSCPAVACPQSIEDYVRLPSLTVATSTQCLSSQSTEEQNNSHTEEDQHLLAQEDASEVFWPQGGATQGSGYCQLPTEFTQTELG